MKPKREEICFCQETLCLKMSKDALHCYLGECLRNLNCVYLCKD